MSTPTWRPGTVVWRELMTADLAKSTAFYTALFGWTTNDVDMGPAGIYRMLVANGVAVAGAFAMKGVPPMWTQYVSVDDVDKTAAAITAAGGKVVRAPADIPNVGRFAMCVDPQGAAFCPFKSIEGDMPPTATPGLGTFCWDSLATTDQAAAIAFYTKIFPWKTTSFHGNITVGTGPEGKTGVADIGAAPPGAPAMWMSHVLVKDLAESRDRAVALGGKVLMAEIAIPQTGKFAVIADSEGAVLSIFQPQMG